MSAWAPAKKLDDKGRCCGRKPVVYKRPSHLFCTRCDRSFDLNGKQIANWAYGKNGDGFDRVGPPYPKDKTLGKIVTEHIYPPIPVRQFDWVAHYDDPEGPCGYGASKAEAIDDLCGKDR